jgi:uncharacterized protein (DUF1501 family)
MKAPPSRRQFLRTGCAALRAAAFARAFDEFGLVSALAAPATGAAPARYKALVCVYLDGGNDGNNTIVPCDKAGYQGYQSAREPLLAIPQPLLLPITPPSLGTPFGLHPSLADLHPLWSQRKLAVVCNVGTLIQPTTRATYLSRTAPLPYQLFSHSDQSQQQQTARADARVQTGWAGSLSDVLTGRYNRRNFPMVTSVAGTAIFAQGAETQPLGIAPAPTPLTRVLMLNGFDDSAAAAARRKEMDFLRSIDRKAPLVSSGQDALQRALDYSLAFTSDPPLGTNFPDTPIGNQLKQVAKVMKLNRTDATLGLARQVFFCQLGGFDTHQEQGRKQAELLGMVASAMKAFYDATVELEIAADVTTFTLSDFSRTLEPSGSGSDHGWGNHLFVVGGSVRGGDFYGVPGANGSVYPTLELGGPDDADSRGRWIPTAAVEQYAATLATWFGLAPSDVPAVFPLIGRFTTADLGFMSAPPTT